ncbi:MAG TPA: LON peptidase substrate-binding domain-containing protein [Candidatus Nitrosocosmicus sp.]|nr:LON peptidase substrate-binding domain-containing protein [Candidatus Nitrosocosmicus sp.]
MATRHYVPIFPLPDLALFPNTLLPLHIFEPRYRAMVTDALARDRRLAIVGLKPGYEGDYAGHPAVHEVAGLGRIVKCERMATGRFNLLLKGELRVRIERELPSDTLYRLVQSVELQDSGAERASVPALLDEVKRACRRILEMVRRATPEMEETLAAAVAPGVLCDQVASAVVPSPAARQALLEELDVERRLRRLLAELQDLLQQLKGR